MLFKNEQKLNLKKNKKTIFFQLTSNEHDIKAYNEQKLLCIRKGCLLLKTSLLHAKVFSVRILKQSLLFYLNSHCVSGIVLKKLLQKVETLA